MLQESIMETSWTTTHFYSFYKIPASGMVTRTHVLTEKMLSK